MANRGQVCMFVGYAVNHAGDYYRIYDNNTERVHLTRDIRWLNRMYFAVDGVRQEDMTVFDEFDEDEEEYIQIDNETEAENDNEVVLSNPE